jgi:spore germination protein
VVDAAPIAFDVAPRVEDGIALIPARHVLERLGAQVQWDNQRKTATLQLGARTAVLRVRENEVQVDGKPILLEARLRIVRGRILVPPAVLRELLDAELLYDGATGQVAINTGRE